MPVARQTWKGSTAHLVAVEARPIIRTCGGRRENNHGNDAQTFTAFRICSAGGKPIYLRGGAYGDGSDAALSYIDQIHLDGTKLYERSFNGSDFLYPLGTLAAGTHTLAFDWVVSGSGLAKLMTHVCEHGVEWNPVQITYLANMHTRDYGAWKTGVATGTSGGVAAQDAIVRRGTTFMVVGRGSTLDVGDATVQIYKNGVAQTGWTTARKEKYQGRDGYFQNVEVTVPANVVIGKYTLRMFDSALTPVGPEVPFNVIFNPYRLVDADFTKAHLETFAYDEDEDGDDWGADADHGRDDWTAYHLSASGDRSYKLHSFVQRDSTHRDGKESSVFELAMAATDGATDEFEASLRLFRLMNQRIIWTTGWYGTDVDEMLGDNNTNDPNGVSLTTDDALRFSRNNEDLYLALPSKRITGQCMDFAAGLVALARSIGLPARHAATPSAFDWGGFHAWSEVYLPPALLPKQDGKTASEGATASDHDSWYVFDSTDNFQDPNKPDRWPHSEEAIDPRVDFYASFVSNGASVPYSIFISRLDWCFPGSGLGCTVQADDIKADYATPTDFWMSGSAGSSVSGWLSWGDKDIFRVDLSSAATISLSPSADLDIVLCAYPASTSPLFKCTDASSSKTLAPGEWRIQVFNRSAHDGVHGGNYVRYTLSVN